MIDLSRVDTRWFDQLSLVVDELEDSVGLDPDCVLVVGSACRDILHAAQGHVFDVRATDDVDLGIAVNDWTVSERIEKRYDRVGDNGIRYRIGGMAVDVMPFGGVENPDGITRPAPRGEDLVVFGFQDVYKWSVPLDLPGGAVARIPTPAGYAALKMRSWVDRSVYGENKDAKDLALCVYWYEESPEINDRLYSPGEGEELLIAVGWDYPLAAARMLGTDIGKQLSPANHNDLVRRWKSSNLDALTRDFVLPIAAGRQYRAELRSALAHQLSHNCNA